MAAEAMVKNIRAVQAARGAKGAKGAEDQSLVRKFQTLAGGSTPDGIAGMGTMIAAARAGQSSLPAVLYWPKAATTVQILAQKVLEYRSALRALAAEARAAGLDSRAIALDQSASNEVAASDQRGPLSV